MMKLYKINFESKEIFLHRLKNVEDNEKNELCICGCLDINTINFVAKELLKFKKIVLSLFLKYSSLHIQFLQILCSLTNLKELGLDIIKNNIPFNICKLQKLETFWINGVKKYPLILCDLQNLSHLYTDYNSNSIYYMKKKEIDI